MHEIEVLRYPYEVLYNYAKRMHHSLIRRGGKGAEAEQMTQVELYRNLII